MFRNHIQVNTLTEEERAKLDDATFYKESVRGRFLVIGGNYYAVLREYHPEGRNIKIVALALNKEQVLGCLERIKLNKKRRGEHDCVITIGRDLSTACLKVIDVPNKDYLTMCELQFNIFDFSTEHLKKNFTGDLVIMEAYDRIECNATFLLDGTFNGRLFYYEGSYYCILKQIWNYDKTVTLRLDKMGTLVDSIKVTVPKQLFAMGLTEAKLYDISRGPDGARVSMTPTTLYNKIKTA